MKDRLDGHTLLIGLMADPIRHSLSPTMHNSAFAKLGLNYAYLVFEIDNEKLTGAVDAIRTLEMRGSNVSMPNKQKVLPLLDKLDPAAELIGAVNTIVNDHGVLTGYTTDGIGFMQSLANAGLDIRGEKMTLAGAGGAGTAIGIQAALDGVKEISIFNRHDQTWKNAQRMTATINQKTDCHAVLFEITEQNAFKQEIASSMIYCDATGVGMKPLEDKTLVSDPAWFRKDMIVYDTVYAPRVTKLMTVAHAAGVKHVFNGLEMMLEQGAAAFNLWTGAKMPVDYIRKLLF
ncbi:shikimate dehydrogenase [Liquorilactobacillus satsumensis]|uniref:Shikimate dehydrogenase (NADP(+)) n=1 Tax=Liquorilactobacillus satsumensis DSM 16230 = JCM 12392 TaxID=1423801 RepID=A0A0R1UVI2_9LACO|nr:shikimate dehydrogenase [Liquorilactobacillus satsumensis]KRL97110.1 shikimate 5-dehydrogenase [Liquorilactobacillus satsumensis DSM 16230 = JCM 12392]MCC7666792.1 shikimate dehydrogenase [Liquorilactobacillus satsumensis]MCP9311991.1 shikimate dehydrogenase [Liquorilactobacillus satsumensis]MCP9328535.1 shikimate dehydrogenase [Liquorilactobacillus satsumensis]MCP9358276.1 shikimate dehydrogenase [Liquorilactobacillus satsumensis]